MQRLSRKNPRDQVSIKARKAQKGFNTTTPGVNLKELFSQTTNLTRTRKQCQLNTSPLSLSNHSKETALSKVKTYMSLSSLFKNQELRMLSTKAFAASKSLPQCLLTSLSKETQLDRSKLSTILVINLNTLWKFKGNNASKI